MGEQQPCLAPTEEGFAEWVSEGLAFNPRALDDRNDSANAMLAWAEDQGPAKFSEVRFMLFQREFAVNAGDWVKRFPEESVEDIALKQAAFMDLMARKAFGYRGDNYEEAFGPDIPKIVNQAYMKMVEARARHEV
jgi:hypothetical protein